MKYSQLPRLFPRFYRPARLTRKLPSELYNDKVLHFIWLGMKPLSDEFRSNLSHFACEMKALGGVTLLWMDRKSIDREFRKWLFANNIKAIDTEAIFGSPRRMGTFVYYRAAIASIPANYGMAGDLLRYEIVNRFGGAYLDCDIRAGEIDLKALLSKPKQFVSGYCTKNNFARNDIFYAPPKNPIMAKYRELVERNFTTKIWNKGVSCTRSFLIDFTVLATGPDAFKEAVESFEKVEFVRSDKEYSAMSWVYDHTKALDNQDSLPRVHHDLLLNLIHKPTILDLEKYRLPPKRAVSLVQRILRRQPKFLDAVDRVFISDPSAYREIQKMIDRKKIRVWNDHAALKFACIMKANDLIIFLMHQRKTDPSVAAFADVGLYERSDRSAI